MLTDLYELTMMYGYHRFGMDKNQAVFDLFFRPLPENNTYAIAAGLESAINYLSRLRFVEEDLAYLRSLKLFDETFLRELSKLRFTGEMYAIPEGTVVFPYEPLVRIKAPIIEAQLVETALLNLINHQTLIATKASRIVQAAKGDAILEFGLRRAQGPDAGVLGARAAVIGGCVATSNVLTGQLFGIDVKGTHAHSWVMSFPDELSAFRAYAEVYPDSCLLLVDTYDTIASGVPNAITVLSELKAKGHKPVGIRLDSGDLAYLSKTARKMLDAADLKEAKIFASSDLDEDVIGDLKAQGACVDVWGVGTRLITSYGCPSLGGVYKLSAEIIDGKIIPKIKLSDNAAKITNPGYKKLFRLYDKNTDKALADIIALDHDSIEASKPLRLFDQFEPWKQKTLTNFSVRELLVPVFKDGELVYDPPNMEEIRRYAKADKDTFWDEYKRLRNPHLYKVDLSDELFELKKRLLYEHSAK
jgi:nicotinate phosphoribosyltransferase